MKIIKNLTSDIERAFYNSKNSSFENITISGPTDGESAFKECSNIEVKNSLFELRYPGWHNTNAIYSDCKFTETCRASFWYDKNITFLRCKCDGVKALRECKNVHISDCTFNSEEFGWKCKNVIIQNTFVKSPYIMFGSNKCVFENFELDGKYSFQYVHNLTIKSSNLRTKDAFWHSRNVVISDSIIKGEYLGWYSNGITFINCKISGTQPLCYAKNIKFIDCEFDETCDLCFEYSDVSGNIKGNIASIKNPLSGKLSIEKETKIIIDENDRAKGKFNLVLK